MKLLINHLLRIPAMAMSFSLAAGSLFAQTKDNDIKTDDLIIEKEYQPLLADGHKIEFKGETPSNDTTASKYNYTIIDKVIQIPFVPSVLKPLSLQKHKETHPQTGYVSAGYGTQYTQYLQAELNKTFSKLDQGGLDIHRLDMHGAPQNQKISLNDLTAYNVYCKSNFINTTTLFGSYNVYNRYGYNPSVLNVDADRASIWRSLGEIKDNWQNNLPKSNFVIKGYADIYDYFDKNLINEFSGTINMAGDKTIKKRHHLTFDITGDYTKYNNPADTNRFMLSIKAGYEYHIAGFITHLGLNGTQLNKEFFVMPDLFSEKNIIREYLITYGGWRDRFEKNDMLSLTNQNPFLEATPSMRYSYVDNSYAGVRGALNTHFSYNIEYDNKLYYSNKRNNYGGMALFVPSVSDSTQFSIRYDRVSLNSLKAELSYEDFNTYRITYTLDYNGYSTATEAYAWNMPTFVTGIDAYYRFNKRFYTESSIFYLSGIHALTGKYADVKLKNHFDINLKLDYSIDESWNIFLHVSNLTYNIYYRYYNYPSYPMQVLAGAMFKF